MSNASIMGINHSANALEKVERKEQPLEPLHGHSQDSEIYERFGNTVKRDKIVEKERKDAAVAMGREKEPGNNKAIRNHAKQLQDCSEVEPPVKWTSRRHCLSLDRFPSRTQSFHHHRSAFKLGRLRHPQRKVQHRLSMDDEVSGVLTTKAIFSIGQSHTSDYAIVCWN